MTDAAKRETGCVCGHAAHSGRLCLSEKCWCTVYVASRITPAPPHPAEDAGTALDLVWWKDWAERRAAVSPADRVGPVMLTLIGLATAPRQARDRLEEWRNQPSGTVHSYTIHSPNEHEATFRVVLYNETRNLGIGEGPSIEAAFAEAILAGRREGGA